MLVVEILALIFWSFQLLPQCWINYTHRTTHGLSTSMIILWTYGSFMTALYVILKRYSLLFIIQPNLFLFFSLSCWGQALYYSSSSTVTVVQFGQKYCAFIITILLIGGIQIFVVIRSHMDDQIPNWIFTLLGSLSTIFFGIGFLPQFTQIYQAGNVQGISRLFLCIDMTGAALSVIALLLHTNFEPIAGTCYIVVFLCDLVIIILSFAIPGPDGASPSPDTMIENSPTSPSFRKIESNQIDDL